MKKLDLLKKEFIDYEPVFGKEILDKLSTKTNDGKIFPPYIPFLGKHYSDFGILVYSTAQNIKFNDDFQKVYQNNYSKLNERLFYFEGFKKKYPKDKMSYSEIDISPYKTGVIAALLGIFIYAKFGRKIEDLDEINHWIGISNYYKFSLNNGKKDINPESTLGKYKYLSLNQKENYCALNDELVKKEIEILEPRFIISFRGRKIKQLKEIASNECKVITVNDPSWILQGGSGVFKKNNSWWKNANRIKEKEIIDLIDTYLSFIRGKYSSKKESVKIYLLKYYSDWKN